jgi:hypothetical protein
MSLFTPQATCGDWTPDGRDNGQYSPMEDTFEWKTGAQGQYTSGDIQYLRSTLLHTVLYWKGSKVFADGRFAHVKDCTLAHANIMGPSGMFTFGIENTRFLTPGTMMSGQHCGLVSYNLGQHGAFCAAQYITKNVTLAPGDGNGFSSPGLSFGASGGNPMMPTHSTMAGDDTFGVSCRTPDSPIPSADCNMHDPDAPPWSIISGYWTGFTNVAGCMYFGPGQLDSTAE